MKRKAFERTRLDEERENDKGLVITVRLNDDEVDWVLDAKRLFGDKGASTTVKDLAFLGYSVLHDPKYRGLAMVLFNKKRRISDLGVTRLKDL